MSKFVVAAAKISNLCTQAFQELPEKLTVEFPQDGALQDVSCDSATNLAFINGVLGSDPCNVQACQKAAAQGIQVEFKVSDYLRRPEYPATVKLTLQKGKKTYYFFAACIDEKECIVYEFDRCPTSFRGDVYEFLIFIETWAADRKYNMVGEVSKKIEDIRKVIYSGNGTCELITLQCGADVEQDLLDELNRQDFVQLALVLKPVC